MNVAEAIKAGAKYRTTKSDVHVTIYAFDIVVDDCLFMVGAEWRDNEVIRVGFYDAESGEGCDPDGSMDFRAVDIVLIEDKVDGHAYYIQYTIAGRKHPIIEGSWATADEAAARLDLVRRTYNPTDCVISTIKISVES